MRILFDRHPKRHCRVAFGSRCYRDYRTRVGQAL
jgi:hypothetical protein